MTEVEDAFQAFEKNQAALSSALSRLMVVVERYPELKSNQNFLTLQSQLEGTENRITVARRDYITAVQRYNTELRTIPGRWIAAILYPDAEVKPAFTASETEQNAPKVDFAPPVDFNQQQPQQKAQDNVVPMPAPQTAPATQ